MRPRLKSRPRETEPAQTSAPSPEDGHELRMSFFGHLRELRDRVLRIFVVLVVGAVIGFAVAGPVLDFLLQPYANLFPEGRQLVVLGPTGSIIAYLQVTLLVSSIIVIPVATHQMLMFILPGLKRGEKRLILRSLPAITLLFIVGVAFAWFVLIPPAITFLEGFQSGLFDPQWTADQYIGFVTSLLFWMGVAFETPLVFFMLALLGMVTAGTLLRNWRIAVVGAAVAAAIITPTIDPVNMALVMAPLLTLYLFSIILVMIGRRISRVAG